MEGAPPNYLYFLTEVQNSILLREIKWNIKLFKLMRISSPLQRRNIFHELCSIQSICAILHQILKLLSEKGIDNGEVVTERILKECVMRKTDILICIAEKINVSHLIYRFVCTVIFCIASDSKLIRISSRNFKEICLLSN